MNRSGMLPSVEELANKTKNTTTQVYLRVKDSTREFFEKQAEIYAAKTASEDEAADKKSKAAESKITANALMTTLLDAYAENYTEKSNTELNYRGVRGYLTRQAQAIGTMADDVLINRFYNHWGCDEFGNYESAGDIYTDICNRLNGHEELTKAYPDFSTCGYWFQSDDKGAKAEAVACNPGEDTCTDLNIPLEKWALVTAVVHAFVRKVAGDADNKEIFTPSVMEKLAEAINAHDDRAELAMAVAEVLADYAEQCDV